jgi:hypothetical protein
LPPSERRRDEGNGKGQKCARIANTAEDSHEPMDSIERVEHLQSAARALQRFQKLTTDCKMVRSCHKLMVHKSVFPVIDPIDLAILLHSDPAKTSAEQFGELKRAANDALKQAPAEHFHRRIQSVFSKLTNSKNYP